MNWTFIARHAIAGGGIGMLCAAAGVLWGLPVGAAGIVLNAVFWFVRECWDHGWTMRFDRQGHAEWIAPALACAIVFLPAWLWLMSGVSR